MISAFICGCEGFELTAAERQFITRTNPWGLILFRRNVDTPAQLADLTAAFRDLVGRADAPVLIDQEGGRVRRLRPPYWHDYPSAAAYGKVPGTDRDIEAARLGARLIADDLHKAGITVDCAPVLDLPVPGSHDVIGDRAFGPDPRAVARLGRAFANGLMAGGVLPVVKHLPGHGRARVDSHLELPVVETDAATLARFDYEPFRLLADLPMGMTAHLVYTALDPDHPATTSKKIIDRVIRGAIGFDGLLFSDDLSMEALKGTLGERAVASRDAGCDVLLHCNGKLHEAEQVAAAAVPLEGRAEQRAYAALALLRTPDAFDVMDGRQRLADLLDGERVLS